MAYNRTQVRDLLNASERDLFEASLADHVRTLTGAQVRGKIARTRALRDKYRDLLRRQKIATRGRTGSKLGLGGVANQRTEQKAAVLAEVLQRFEKRAQQLDAAQVRAAEKTAAAAARLEQVQQRTAARKAPVAGAANPRARNAAADKTSAKKAAVKKAVVKKSATRSAAVKKTESNGKATAKKAAVKKATTRNDAAKEIAGKTEAKARTTRPAAAKVLRELLETGRAGAGAVMASATRKVAAKRAPKKPVALGPTSESARATRYASQQQQAGGQRIQGHVGSRVRRAQAKRDSRG